MKSPMVVRESSSSKNEMRPENRIARSPSENGSNSPTTSVLNHSEVAHSEPKHAADFEADADKRIFKSPDANKLSTLPTLATTQPDVAQPEPLHSPVVFMESFEEHPERKSSDSFAEVSTNESSTNKSVPADEKAQQFDPKIQSSHNVLFRRAQRHKGQFMCPIFLHLSPEIKL